MPLTDEQVEMLLKRERAGSVNAEQRADIAALRSAGRLPEALPPVEPTATLSPEDLIARGIIGSGFGTQRFTTPQQAVGRGAFVARTLPGLIPTPLLSSVGSMAGETIAQAAEQGVGAREGFDPLQIGVAGAMPFAVSGVVRGARAIGRTAVRAIPGLFHGAQAKALGAAEEVAQTLTPDITASQLFTAARSAQESVPAKRLSSILDDLTSSIPKTPADPGLRQVREVIDNLRGSIQGTSIDLAELLRQRLDLGRLIARRGSAPELRAIYGHGGANAKGIIGALEEAAEAGGAGAALTREALDVFKRDLGVVKWKDLIEQSTRRTSISGVDTPALNIAKLGDAVVKHSRELKSTLGADGLELIRGFLTRFRSLPPTHAATAATTLLTLMAGAGGGIASGSLPVAIATAVTPEIARNVFAVGRNPAAVNQIMTTLAQATRATSIAPAR